MIKKFSNAFNGLLFGLKHQSIILQVILMMLSLIVFFVLKISCLEWCIVIILLGIVISSEYFNTAIEKMMDYQTKNYDERIKNIKDLSAGAVLISCFSALVVGVMIIINHI